MDAKFEQFMRERKYLKSVSQSTLEWYRQTFTRLQIPNPTQSDLTEFVVTMRESGLAATSVNNRIRAVNAYLRWLGSPLKLGKLKEPQRVLSLYTEDDIKKIAKWKPQEPRKWARTRAQVLALTLADTGCRSSELLTLRWAQVDFDNLLLTVRGKGDKERVIPFSYELRRFLYQWRQKVKHDLVFGTQQGMMVSIRNAHHALGHMLDNLGIKHPRRLVHCFRHSFATFYLKRGGSALHLQRVLGHTTLFMTARYVSLQTADLQAVHQQVSVLSGL
jgi:integrase/recombinase XerD